MSAAPWPRRGVYRLEAGVWFVPSASTPGAFYRVEWHHDEEAFKSAVERTLAAGFRKLPRTMPRSSFSCTCPAGTERGRMRADTACRHVRETSLAEREDGIPLRPVAPPAPGSMFTD